MKETLQTGILPVKTRRIFSAVIVLLAVALVFTAPAGAADAWDGTSEDGSWYSNPSDSEFTIQNGSQLYNLSKLVNAGTDFTGKTVKLGADINLNNKEWTPIGNTNSGGKYFNGTFNGSGHTITGLKITNANGEYHGLFGYVTSGGTIQNLHVSGMIDFDDTSSSSHYAGGIAGHTSGTIENCSASVSIEVKGSGIFICAGGIVGNLGSGIIKNCYSYISGDPLVAQSSNSVTSIYAGGIAGRIDGGIGGGIGGGTVQNCYTTGKVYAEHYASGSSYAGGITGSVTGGTIQNCSALNQYVRAWSSTGLAEDGRIYGITYLGTTLTDNYAWAGMKNPVTGNLLPAGQADNQNGASKSSNDIWDKLFSPFNDENVWKKGTTEKFKLPILKNLPEPTNADASYLNPTNSGGNSNTGGSGGSSAVILSSTSKYRDSVKAEFKAVTFDANGGIGYMEKQQLPVGEAGELNNNEFTNGGAAFIGWALEPNGPVVYADGEEVTLQGDITLYAVWVEPLPEIPDVPEPASTPAPVLGMMLGGLTAALVLRRK